MSFLEYNQFSFFSLNFKSVPFRSFQRVNLLLYAEANKMIDCSTLACLFFFFRTTITPAYFQICWRQIAIITRNPVLTLKSNEKFLNLAKLTYNKI